MSANEIIKGKLWMGGTLDARYGGSWPAPLQNGELDAVINLEYDADHGLPDRLFKLHWPIEDGPLPNLQILESVVYTVVHLIEEGERVLVHCSAGLNRSGLVSALALIDLADITGDKAVEVIRMCRGPQALCNRTFENYVRSYTRGSDEN